MSVSDFKKEKDLNFQLLRGLACLAVVLIHAPFPFYNAAVVVWRQCIIFTVPIFVFMSGYFSYGSYLRDSSIFVKKRLNKILIPFLVWNALHIVIFKPPFLTLITGYGQLYYLVVLMQLIVLTPYFVKVINSKVLFKLCMLSTPVYIIIYFALAILRKDYISFPQSAVLFPAWSSYYIFGLWVSQRQSSGRQYYVRGKLSILALIISLMLSVTESLLIYYGVWLSTVNQHEFLAISSIKIGNMIFSFALINLFLYLKDRISIKGSNMLTRIGDESMSIYYMHNIFLHIVTPAIVPGIYYTRYSIVMYIISTALAVILSIITAKFLRGIFGKKLVAQVLSL